MIAGNLNIDLKARVYSNQENRVFDELKIIAFITDE